MRDPDLLTRIRSLAVPPAWQDVWICPLPNGHIQAVGTDAAGRRQYLYHAEWRRARDAEKHDRARALAPRLPAFRERIEADLGGRPGRERAVAVALRLFDRGILRVGGDEYVESNGSHGAATLYREHVNVRGSVVTLRFPGKGGAEQSLRVDDRPLATAVAGLLRARGGGPRLLGYRERGSWHDVHAEDVNARFKELVGNEFTVKDLRTWTATVLAAVALAERPVPSAQRARRRAEVAMFREVAEHLGDTPAVARASYVDPRVIERFEQGRTVQQTVRRIGSDLSDVDRRAAVERAVVRLLRTD